MFFQSEENLLRLDNPEAMRQKTMGMDEKEIVEYVISLVRNLYSGNRAVAGFLSFIRKKREEVFLYLEDSKVPKTSNLAEQHFSIQSWHFKNRFKTAKDLRNISYWYHKGISTEI